jgi:hypothetical protein
MNSIDLRIAVQLRRPKSRVIRAIPQDTSKRQETPHQYMAPKSKSRGRPKTQRLDSSTGADDCIFLCSTFCPDNSLSEIFLPTNSFSINPSITIAVDDFETKLDDSRVLHLCPIQRLLKCKFVLHKIKWYTMSSHMDTCITQWNTSDLDFSE